MKRGFDVTGTVLGLLTIPMAVLSLAGLVAGAILAVRQEWAPLLPGFAAILSCSVAARPLEALVIAIDAAAARSFGQAGWRTRALALAGGTLPVVVIFGAEVLCLRAVLCLQAVPGTDGTAPSPSPLLWLWGYGAATAPWTLFAFRVGRFRRTLVGIRAYAGHIALWLFSILALWLRVPVGVAMAAMLVPAILPVTVGLLLALADRAAIANVRL